MTSNTVLYKDKGPKCSAGPQIFLIFVAVFIFHQSFTTQNGLGITFMLKSWPYLLKTLSYVMLIVAAAVLATNWSAKNLLCLSIAGIGMLHLIQGILDQTIDARSEQLDDFFKRLMSIAYGVTHAPVLPCVYVLLARLTTPYERASAGSLVFSAKQFSTVLFLSVTTCCANDNSFLKVYYATYSIFGLIAVVWSIVYYFVGSNCDLEFVDQAPSFKPRIPWSSILSSLPVWTLILSHASSFAVQVVTMNRLESLHVSKYDVFLLSVMGGIASGWLSDVLVAKNHLTRLRARKIFNSLAICVPMSAFIVMTVLEHTSPTVHYNYSIAWATVQVVLIVLTSFQNSGFMINHIDLSPYYAGILIAVTEIANQIVTGLVILGTNLCADQLTGDWFSIVIQILLAASSIYMGIFFAICSDASIQEKWSPVPSVYQDQNRLHKV